MGFVRFRCVALNCRIRAPEDFTQTRVPGQVYRWYIASTAFTRIG